LSVGVITSLIGGPFFIWLLYTRRKVLRELL
jgi:ABC-type Fe3+-siderophore transport system permease subunit